MLNLPLYSLFSPSIECDTFLAITVYYNRTLVKQNLSSLRFFRVSNFNSETRLRCFLRMSLRFLRILAMILPHYDSYCPSFQSPCSETRLTILSQIFVVITRRRLFHDRTLCITHQFAHLSRTETTDLTGFFDCTRKFFALEDASSRRTHFCIFSKSE